MNFKIGKYAFFSIRKRNQQKNCAWEFKIRKYVFLTFEKKMNKKIAPGFLRFVSIFSLIIQKGSAKKLH